jgi:hypothetical protein
MPAKRLDIYLDDGLRASAEAGKHNYFNQIAKAFGSRGFTIAYHPNDQIERLLSVGQPGYSLFHMDAPIHDRALTTRRAYFYPFWRIEASDRRWEWTVAKASFDPDSVDPEEATRFCNLWRKRLFGEAPDRTERAGFIYMPLQGRLSEHRSFQTMSPVQMIERTLETDPGREVLATLHPKETYAAEDRAAMEALMARYPALRLSDRPMEELLAGADYVVTQNSSAALAGFFFGKPAVLFARSDFHHIAEDVCSTGIEDAFSRVTDAARPFDRYLYWFLQLQSINAGRPDAPDQILRTVRERGWQV